MPNYTLNLNLKKPGPTENYNVDDQNGNMDLLDEAVAARETPAGAQAKADAAAAEGVAAAGAVQGNLATHQADNANPHAVTVAQIGALKFADIINDFIVSGTVPATSTTLTTTIPNQIAYVLGQRVDKANEEHTFTASKDTYIDLSNTASYTYVEVANAAAAPDVTANSIRMFKIVTDASAITTVTDLRILNPKINKNAEMTSNPTTALGLATKQYVDGVSPTWLFNGYRNLPVPVTSKFIGVQKHGFFSNMAAGNTTIYTVPAGKRAFFHVFPIVSHNPTAGNIVIYTHIVPSGGTAGTGNRIYKNTLGESLNSAMYVYPSLLDAGDSIVLNTDVAGLNSWHVVMEFDETDTTGYRLEFLSNVGTAVTTVYTVPDGKKARVNYLPLAFNTTAAAITFTAYFVPSGGTAGSKNKFYSASVGAENYVTLNTYDNIILNSGDSVQVVGSEAGCNFWIPILEF